MSHQSNTSDFCPIARAVAVLGNTWNILILRDAHFGASRFDQFRKNLGIAPTILTKRLSFLVDEGLLIKKQYLQHPPREEYILTEAGLDFLPNLFMLAEWGKKHRANEGYDHKIYDSENGTEVKPILVDQVTGAKIGSRKLHQVNSG